MIPLELQSLVMPYVSPTVAEWNALLAHGHTHRLRKGAYLLEQGQVCRDLVVLQQGILRHFHEVEGVEVSVWFAFAGDVGTEVQSFICQQPTRFFTQAIEDCAYWSITHTALEELCARHPVWSDWLRQLWGETIVYMIDRLVAFQHQTAEQRYQALLTDPAYLQKIPQKYLASYLGITPTSLSRLRRQIR